MIRSQSDQQRRNQYVSIFKQIVVFLIKKELISQFKIQKFSENLIKLILIGCEIEILGLWLASIRKSNFTIYNTILNDYIDMHLQVAQPYDDLITQETLAIVILIIQTIHYIYYLWEFVIFYIKKQKKFVSFTKYFEKQPEFKKQLQSAMYYYNNIFNQVLLIPYLDINFSLLTNLFSGERRIGFITISLLNIIFVMFQSIIFETFLAESLSIKRKNFEYLRYSFNNILQYLLIIILIILKSSPLDNQTRFVLMSISLIFHHMFKIINIFQVNQPSKLTTFKITLLTFMTFLPIQFFCYKQMKGFDIFYFIISPILSILLIFQFQYQQSRRLFSGKLQPDVIQYLLSLTLDEDQPSTQSQLNYSIFLRYHSQDCVKAKCFCKKNNIQDIKMEYLKQLCIQFSQTLIIVGEEAERFNYYLHFLSTMNYLGLNTQALKQAANIDFDSQSYLSMQSMKKQVSSSSNLSIKEKDKLQVEKKRMHFKNLSGVQQIKLDILKETIQSGLNVNFKRTDNQRQESFSLTVKQFFEQEERQRQQISEILRLINRKRQFLMDIMSKINLNTKELFIKSKRLIIELEQFYENVNIQYQAFPSQKLQSILSFFLGEIQGNYQKSHKISTLNKVNDEKLLGLQNQMTINLFSNRINYINCILNNDLTLRIKEKSNNCYKFFEYKKPEFDLVQSINNFLPYGFSLVHKSLISQFLESGESKYFRTSNLNLAMTKNKFIKQFEFSFEINQTNQENLEFIAFLEDHELIHDNIIIVSPNNKIGGVSKNFLKSVSFSNQTINLIDPLQLLYKHSIGYLIPEFHTVSSVSKTHILQDKQVHYSTNYSQKFYFLKEDYVLEQIEKQGQRFDWSNPDNLEVFTAVSRITKVELYEESYLIITLNNIKVGGTSLSQSKYTLTKSSFKQDFNVTSLDVSSEDGFQFPNAIVSNRPRIIINQNKEDIQFGNKFEVITKQEIITKQEVQNLDATSMQQEKIEASYYSPYQQQILFSPKESFSGILQDKRKVQQLFFQSSFKDFSESNQKQSSSEKQIDIAQELFQLEADEQFRKVIQEQLQLKRAQQNAVEVDDVGSQVSSLVGFKKSKYYKKYELYDLYQESPIFPQTFKTMIYYYLFGILIGFTFSLIVSINSSVDLQRFLNEIDMLSIKGYLMGPFYKFNIVLNSLAGYRFSIDYGGAPQDEMYQWMSFTAMEFNRTYDMLKDSFQDQMSNPYLQQFFVDEYIEVRFQTGIDGIETRNITLREALSFLVLNGYIFKQTDPTSPLPAANNPFITYYLANIIKFTDRFDLLTEVIQDYTNNRTYQVAEKWLAILIPLMCFFIVFKFISYYYYRQYLYNYDHACSLFNFIDMKSAQNEVQRLKVIQDLITKDPSTVYRYQFDIELKDSFILSQQNIEEQRDLANLKQKHQQQNRSLQKLSTLPSILCFIFLAAIFLIYATLINILVQRFLISYRPSIEYFKSLSEASISISGIYNFRDFTYLVNGGTFFYYTSADNQPFVNNFNADILNVIEFQQNLVSFSSQNILTSEKFNNLVNLYRANNLCSFINGKNFIFNCVVDELTKYFNPLLPKPVIQDYCDVIYSGVMNLGLQPTLVEAVNKLQSEYQINNFTSRTGFVTKEFELPMIASQILIQLLAYYKQSLVDIADQLIYQIQILSSFTIVYLAIKSFLLVTSVLNYTKKEFLQSKKFLQLLPQNLLFIDSEFERFLRTFAAQQQLI